jgi:hypothetical protein
MTERTWGQRIEQLRDEVNKRSARQNLTPLQKRWCEDVAFLIEVTDMWSSEYAKVAQANSPVAKINERVAYANAAFEKMYQSRLPLPDYVASGQEIAAEPVCKCKTLPYRHEIGCPLS